jgi:ketosteroid isomerase-like protein
VTSGIRTCPLSLLALRSSSLRGIETLVQTVVHHEDHDMRARHVLVLLLCLSCQPSEVAQQRPSIEDQSRQARVEIDSVMAHWDRWLAEAKIDSMAGVFTEDVITMAPNQAPIVGRAAWVDVIGPQLTQGTWSSDNVTESIVASGPLAVERGRYILTFTPPPGAAPNVRAVSDTGKYLWHWRKVDGRWKVAGSAWNSNRSVQP